jgi:hypothetical protein
MKNIKKIGKLTLVAVLVIFCLACEEKKAAKSDSKESGSPTLRPVAETQWGTGRTNGDYATLPTRLVVMSNININARKTYTRAVYQNKVLKIRYIGEKETAREPVGMENNYPNYETMRGSDYEIIDFDTTGCEGTCGNRFFFLYNDSEKWGNVPYNIVYSSYKRERPAAYKADIEAMEKQQNSRKIVNSEVIANFDIDGEANSLMLLRYKNTSNGLFQIVLRDHNYNYFNANFPSQLFNGKAKWQPGVDDNPGFWILQFVGRVAEGLFIVTEWVGDEGNGHIVFVAENGKLKISN